jgi:hypothetical protein
MSERAPVALMDTGADTIEIEQISRHPAGTPVRIRRGRSTDCWAAGEFERGLLTDMRADLQVNIRMDRVSGRRPCCPKVLHRFEITHRSEMR